MVNMAKYNHLALVRREDMVELFKNSFIYPVYSVKFTGSINDLPRQTKLVKKIFRKTPVIEYSTDYFLLYAKTSSTSALTTTGIRVEDLLEIIPLDEDSSRRGLTLMPPVRLSAPIFKDNFLDFQENSAVENAKLGINNIEALFGLKNLWKSINWKSIKWKSAKINQKDFLPRIVSLISGERISIKEDCIFEYLLCYQRMHAYPKDIVCGAFLDTLSLVADFHKGSIVDQQETHTGKVIMENVGKKYQDMVHKLEFSQDSKVQNFIKISDEAYPGFWKIAPLYFILLDFFSNVSEDGGMVKGRPVKEFISDVVKSYNEKDLKPALLMLGLTLGQSSTYKILYTFMGRERFAFLE